MPIVRSFSPISLSCILLNTLLMGSLCSEALFGADTTQASFSTIRDVIYQPDGKPFTGTISAMPQSFGDVNPPAMVAGIDDGVLVLRIVPTEGSPSGANYSVTFTSSDRKLLWTETWHVPLSDHLSLKDVRTDQTGAGQDPVIRDLGNRGTAIQVPIIEISGLSAALSQINAALANATAAESNLQQALATDSQSQLVSGEVPTGTMNGSNAVFTLSHVPMNNSLALWKGGVRLLPGVDYTLSGLTITLSTVDIPNTRDALTADYYFLNSSVSRAASGGGLAVPVTPPFPLPLPMSDVTGLSAALNQINQSVQSLKSSLNSLSVTAASLNSIVNVVGEVPVGVLNGSNVTFTLAKTPSPSTSVRVYRNGQRLNSNLDYGVNGSTITFVSQAIPQAGDVISVDYTAKAN